MKVILIFEFVLLVLGVCLPLATIDEFWFFSSQFSIISLVTTLFNAKEYLLSIVIITFGLIFPFLKIVQRFFTSWFLLNWPIHKLSMVDIFLLSFFIFGGKLSYFYEVNLKSGSYCLILSVLLSYCYLFIDKNPSKQAKTDT